MKKNVLVRGLSDLDTSWFENQKQQASLHDAWCSEEVLEKALETISTFTDGAPVVQLALEEMGFSKLVMKILFLSNSRLTTSSSKIIRMGCNVISALTDLKSYSKMVSEI